MAYVPEFKHDIFISYARADDAMDPQGVQWVSDFQVYLRRTVKQHLYGNEPAVFFDALDLDPNQPIQTVLANARQSAVFLPVISPSYVARRWPNDELNAFSEEVGEQGRIFAIELLPVPDELPLPLRNLRRKEFWWKDEKEGSAPRKFTPKYRSDKYTDYLEDVAYLVAKRLRAMHPEGDTQARNASSVAGKTVLLAEVTDDLRRVRRQVREYLEQFPMRRSNSSRHSTPTLRRPMRSSSCSAKYDRPSGPNSQMTRTGNPRARVNINMMPPSAKEFRCCSGAIPTSMPRR